MEEKVKMNMIKKLIFIFGIIIFFFGILYGLLTHKYIIIPCALIAATMLLIIPHAFYDN